MWLLITESSGLGSFLPANFMTNSLLNQIIAIMTPREKKNKTPFKTPRMATAIDHVPHSK